MGDRIEVTASNGAIGVVQGDVYLGEGPRRLTLSSGCTPLPGQPLPSQYLVARHEVVDYAGRDALLAELAAWATSEHSVRVRLLMGPAGAGKTRLGQAWVRACRARGEAAGFLDDALEPAVVDALAAADGAVVIDYAETRSTLGALLTRLARRCDEGRPGRLRVLLLARGIGDWWRLATRDDAALALVQDVDPQDLPPIGAPDRAAEFTRAAGFFQARRGWSARPSPPDLSDPHYGRPLYLHLAAWLAGEGDRLDLAEDLPGRLLNHEAKYWLKRGGFEGRTDDAAQAFELAMQAAVAALALRGGARDAAHLAAIATGPPCTLLPTLYPAPGLHVGPLQPDLLAEALVLRHLRAEPEGRIDAALAAADATELRTAFTLLARAEGHDPTLAARAQTHVLATDLDTRGRAAFEALLALAERTAHATLGQRLAEALEARGSPELAARLQPALPWESVMLREVALWVEQALLPARARWWVRWLLWWRWKPERRAARLYDLSKRLADLGRHEKALTAITEAVRLRRRAARVGRTPELQDRLASSLLSLGVDLGALGRREEALAATAEAVERYRTLAAARPDAFTPDLARSLNNLGNMLSALGRREEALAATAEAVDLRRTLAAARPDAFTPDLAMSLTGLGAHLSALGRREEALAATAEAVERYRSLAVARPDAFTPDLAASLNNLGTMLSALGRREEALAATAEAVDLRRTLVAARPDAFTPDLARSLNNLGNRLSALGRREEALAATAEAVERYRTLAAARPDAFTPDLAGSLNNLGNMLSALGRREEALAATAEAVDLRRTLAAARPDAFTPDLAMSLSNLGAMLSALGRREEALAATAEAVELRRTLAAARPDAFTPDLASSLNNLGSDLSALGRREEALAATAEAVELRHTLAAARPDAFTPDLARSVSVHGDVLAALGRHDEARRAADEALELLWPFFERLPSAYAGLMGALLDDCFARNGDPPVAWVERRRRFEQLTGAPK